MEQKNDELLAKLQEYKSSMSSRMADQLDRMIISNRETIRMKCLETAVEYAKLRSKVNEFWSKNGLKEMAEEFYQFVKGE